MFIYTLSDIVQLAIVAIIVVALAATYVVGLAMKAWNRLKG